MHIKLILTELLKEIYNLVLNDFKIDWRQKNVLMSIKLYVFSTVFLIYIGFSGVIIDKKVWMGLFWIVILFSIVNSVGTSFAKERKELRFYYTSLASMEAILIGKMIYNIILMLFVGIICYCFFVLLTGGWSLNLLLFAFTLFMGITGLTSVFTLVNALAIKADNNFTLSAILGIPLIIPLLIIIINLSVLTSSAGNSTEVLKYFLLLTALNGIVFSLVYLFARFIKG